ncbi:MAG: translation initiation factor IF-3 [candidate division Zixibacteria bacterium]|nr:translation initiation factor IF-3 [candidate division Zixibacteria bacterium]
MSNKSHRINHQVRVSPVRLIGHEGEQVGIVPVEEALKRAESVGMDLVEVSPNSRPPVCRILDYGKFKYEIAKKDKQAKKKQHSLQMKEMRFRPKIDEHDFQFKTKHVREFLLAGNKVKTFVMFRGREMAYQEFGKKVLVRVTEELSDIAVVEQQPKMEGRHMNMVLVPSAEVMREIRKTKAEKVNKRADEKRKSADHKDTDDTEVLREVESVEKSE